MAERLKFTFKPSLGFSDMLSDLVLWVVRCQAEKTHKS